MTIDLRRSVRTYVTLGDETSLNEIVDSLKVGECTLTQLIKDLGEYLLHEDDQVRFKGASVLSHAIRNIPAEQINRQATQTLTSFFLSKLSDHTLIAPTLEALTTLAQLQTFGSLEAKNVCTALFDCLKPPKPQFIQAVRYLYYQLLDTLLHRHRGALKSLGGEFVSGYIHTIQGEKDPRNLMLVFGMNRVVLIEFDTQSHTEAFFDVVFCYFPITFKPPPDDPYGISTDDLRLALRSDISASPFFAEQGIPLLIEKLTASSGAVKRDALLSIADALPVYGPGQVSLKSRKLWDAISIEILYSTDLETENVALNSLESLIRTLYQESEPTDLLDARELPGIANVIFDVCYDALKEPEKSKASPAVKIVAALIEACPSALGRPFTHSTLIPLLELFAVPAEPSQPGPILNHIHAVLVSLSKVYSDKGRSYAIDKPINESLREQLNSTLTSSMNTKSLRGPALAAFTQTLHINGYWDVSKDGVGIANTLIDFIKDPNEDSHIRLVAIEGLKCLGADILQTTVLPSLVSALPASVDVTTDWKPIRATLASITSLAVDENLFSIYVDGVKKTLEVIQDDNYSLAYVNILLTTLLVIIQEKSSKKHSDIAQHSQTFLPKLYAFFVVAHPGAVRESRLVDTAGKVIHAIVRSLDAAQQESYVKQIFNALVHGYWQDLLVSKDDIVHQAPLAQESSQRSYLPLLASALIAVRREVALPLDSLSDFATKLTQWTTQPESTIPEQVASQHLLANLVNKRIEKMPEYTTYLLAEWNQRTSEDSQANTAFIHIVQWIAKGLICRNDKLGVELVMKFLDLIASNSVYADRVAGVIGGIANDNNDGILDKKHSHAVSRILYKQKFFDVIFPEVVARYESASTSNGELVAPLASSLTHLPDDTSGRRYLATLAHLIQHMPKSLALAKLPQIFPILLIALSLDDTALRSSVIETITVLTLTEESIAQTVQQHMSSLISTLLAFATDATKTSPRLRVSALKLLSIFPTVIRKDILEQYKMQTVRQLIVALDDPVKMVRKEAVDAREYWWQV
ncbi:hypothetical protein E3P99_00068 [Wallemia hederae]|uniref:MMS19 nucleotide excision repair protein n=1 Tax=Wallemia hederae TaxID=1540922 RepID=A0A4T0G0D1_9BASI|nr:hypothetical protein E3P99_00068 [Wallemia hederae]